MIDKTVFENKIAAYYTLGCKLNFAETSTIGKVLAEQGVRKARPGEKADICVVNTCSVTELADKKCRQAIRRIGKQHPGAFIVVTGCYAQLKPEEVSHIEGVDLVLGAEQKLDLFDQIRFELTIKALAPDIKIIAPWRDSRWTLQSREDEIEYCRQHGIHLPFSPDSSYSRDRNIWHISHEGLELEDPANEPNYKHLLVLGCSPEDAPDEGEYVTMTFEKGVPTSVNGKKMKVSDIIRELNRLGGKHGIGIIDIVENRVVGMKSRGVYETPGGTILYEAHQQLEELILDRDTTTEKINVANKFAQVIYEGKWETPLREALQAFIEKTQEYVTGEVKFKLYKGNIIKAGTTSPYSLYNESIASFTTGDLYDHHDADGFINLFGLPVLRRGNAL